MLGVLELFDFKLIQPVQPVVTLPRVTVFDNCDNFFRTWDGCNGHVKAPNHTVIFIIVLVLIGFTLPYNRRVGFNIADAKECPPRKAGEDNPKAKLSEADILSISQEFAKGALVSQLARKYGVASNTIASILYGKSWQHIERQIFIPIPKNKLTEADVVAIKERLIQRELCSDIAKDYGISIRAVAAIEQGEAWKTVQASTELKPRRLRRKLTESNVLEIKQRMILGEKDKTLAQEFGVGESTIASIRNGDGWSHILPEIDLKSTFTKFKIDRHKASEIKQRILNGESNQEIAQYYGISHKLVSDIRRNKSWRKVEPLLKGLI